MQRRWRSLEVWTAGPPDVWFADAAQVGLGLELELAAIRSALAQLPNLPEDLYLTVNASPATVSSPNWHRC